MLKEFRENRKEAKQLFAVCAPLLLGFILLYNATYTLVVRPFGQFLWSLALRYSPVAFISNENILGLYSSPLILLCLLVLGVGFAYWALFNIASILLCLEHIRKEERFTLWGLFRESIFSIVHVFKPRNLPLLFFAAVVLPFTNVIMTTTFVNDLVIPEYIAEVIHGNLLYKGGYWILVGAALLLIVRYLFVLHFFVLEKCDLSEAMQRNNTLIRGNRKKSFFQIICWKFLIQIKYAIWMVIILLLAFLLVDIISNGAGSALVATLLVGKNVLFPFFLFLFGCFEVFAQYGFISILYYRYQAGERATEVVSAPVIEETPMREKRFFCRRKKQKRPFAWLIYVLSAAVVITTAVGILVMTVMIGGTNFLDKMLQSGIEITCHRGDCHAAPENTLPAIQAAIDGGVSQYAELDVQMTKDGVVVLTHDTSLKRCTGVDVNVHEVTFEELKKLDAGSFFSEEFAGTPIPSLEEVIDLAKGKIKLNIEIKNSGYSPELEEEVVRIIQEKDFEDQCVVTSISYDTLAKVKQADSSIKTGYIMALGVGNYYDLPYADFFSVESTFITYNMVDELHRRGKEVHAWTIDTERDIQKMIRLEVDNVITGKPEMIHSELYKTMDSIILLLQNEQDWESIGRYFSESVFLQLSEFYGVGTVELPEGETMFQEGTLEEVIEKILHEA